MGERERENPCFNLAKATYLLYGIDEIRWTSLYVSVFVNRFIVEKEKQEEMFHMYLDPLLSIVFNVP